MTSLIWIVTLSVLYYYFNNIPTRLENFHTLFVDGFAPQTQRLCSYRGNKIKRTDRRTNIYGIKYSCLLKLYYHQNDRTVNTNEVIDNNAVSSNRRSILQQSIPMALGISSFIIGTNNNILHQQPAYAAVAPVDAGEAIRRSTANIPGYGPTDIFYPVDWLGIWHVRRDVFLPGATEPIPLDYKIRFIPSIQENAVVADRGYNQIALEIAIRKNQSNDVVRSFKWTETNPNDLFLEFYDGTRKYIKVTKRSTEYDATSNTISSSEFQRVTQDIANGNGGVSVPTITARRIVSKWKTFRDEESKITKIEAIEVAYDMGSGLGDPLSFQPSPQSEPVLLSKSKLVLERPIQ